MAADVTYEGLDTVQALFKAMPENLQKWQQFEVVDAVNDVFNESQRQCPVDTGSLRGSGTVQVTGESPFEVTIGYGGAAAGYALVVHENLMAHHAPPTKAKFLEDPANDVFQGLEGVMQTTVEGAIVGHFPGAPSLSQSAEMGTMAKITRRSRRWRTSHTTPMSHYEIGQAIAAIDRGTALRTQGKRAVRRFYRGTQR